jgi:hypothetical protein
MKKTGGWNLLMGAAKRLNFPSPGVVPHRGTGDKAGTPFMLPLISPPKINGTLLPTIPKETRPRFRIFPVFLDRIVQPLGRARHIV